MTELEMFKQTISEGLSQKFDEVVAQASEDSLDELWEQSAREQEALIVPSTLMPGGDCLGDGLHPGYRCMCEGCDYEAECLEAHVDHELLAKLQSE